MKKHPYPGWGTHTFQKCHFAEEDKSHDKEMPPSKKPKCLTESTAEIHEIKDEGKAREEEGHVQGEEEQEGEKEIRKQSKDREERKK